MESEPSLKEKQEEIANDTFKVNFGGCKLTIFLGKSTGTLGRNQQSKMLVEMCLHVQFQIIAIAILLQGTE